MNKVFYGENSTREARPGCCYNLHAEMDVIRKLPKIKVRGRKKNISFVIIRIDRKGRLKNSGPCSKCVEHFVRLEKSGYKIKNIFYSDKNGDIIMCKLDDLINKKQHVTKRFRKA